jgi:TldD protein
MKDRLADALKRADVDYCEIRYETNDASQVGYRGKQVETAQSAKYTGGVVRACHKGGWGNAVFSTLEELEEMVEAACASARMVGREETLLAPVEPQTGDIEADMRRDPREVSLADKIALVREANEVLLDSHPAIRSTRCIYADQFRSVHYANTDGACFREQRPDMVLRFHATASRDSLVQSAHESFRSSRSFDDLAGRLDEAREVSERAGQLLDAPSGPSGAFTVVLDPEMAGVFCHEAFGHLSEADFLYENPKMRELMKVGKLVGVDALSIVDDGTQAGLGGTWALDDEGTPMKKTDLIRDGHLAGHLHSRETAARMGADPTGNARSVSRKHAPIVRMTNTFIEAGDVAFEEMIRDIDDGIYACGAFGGQTMLEEFTFSAAYAYRIRKGRIEELLRDVMFTGNVFETLYAIDAVGNDLKMYNRGGGCGKAGQSPLPVSFGSPHLRIRDVVVGGR